MLVEDIVQTITEYLDKEELHYEYIEDSLRFDLCFKLDDSVACKTDIRLLVDEEGSDCLIVGSPNLGAISKNKTELIMLLFAINSQASRGIWQIDEDNEVRYIRTLPLEGDAVLTDEMLETFIYSVPQIVDRYADSIAAVSMGLSTSEKELEALYNESEEVAETSPNENESSDTRESDALEGILLWINDQRKAYTNRVTAETIIKKVCDKYGISEEKIRSNNRNSEILLPRRLIMYFCSELADMSLEEISCVLGKRNHTTVMNGINKIKEQKESDRALSDTIAEIEREIRQYDKK